MSVTLPLCSRCAYLYRCRLGASSFRTSSTSSSRTVSRRLEQTSRPFCSSQATLQSSKRPLVTSAASVQTPTLETTPPPPRNAGATAVPGMNDLRPPQISEEAHGKSGSIPKLRNVAGTNAFKAATNSQEEGTQAQRSTGTPATPAASTAPTVPEPTQSTSSSQPTAAPSKPRPKLRALRAAIKLTPAAVTHVRALLDQPSPKLLRIGTRRRGCSGLAYHLEYVDKADKLDEVVKQDGIEILVESRALLTVLGTTMDWVDEKLGSRFEFNNPNIKEQCGCGESFMV